MYLRLQYGMVSEVYIRYWCYFEIKIKMLDSENQLKWWNATIALASQMWKVVSDTKTVLKMNFTMMQTVITTLVLPVLIVILRKTARTFSVTMMTLRMKKMKYNLKMPKLRTEHDACYVHGHERDDPAHNFKQTAGENNLSSLAVHNGCTARLDGRSTSDRRSGYNNAEHALDRAENGSMQNSNDARCGKDSRRNKYLVNCGSTAGSNARSASSRNGGGDEVDREIDFNEYTRMKNDYDTKCVEK